MQRRRWSAAAAAASAATSSQPTRAAANNANDENPDALFVALGGFCENQPSIRSSGAHGPICDFYCEDEELKEERQGQPESRSHLHPSNSRRPARRSSSSAVSWSCSRVALVLSSTHPLRAAQRETGAPAHRTRAQLYGPLILWMSMPESKSERDRTRRLLRKAEEGQRHLHADLPDASQKPWKLVRWRSATVVVGRGRIASIKREDMPTVLHEGCWDSQGVRLRSRDVAQERDRGGGGGGAVATGRARWTARRRTTTRTRRTRKRSSTTHLMERTRHERERHRGYRECDRRGVRQHLGHRSHPRAQEDRQEDDQGRPASRTSNAGSGGAKSARSSTRQRAHVENGSESTSRTSMHCPTSATNTGNSTR